MTFDNIYSGKLLLDYYIIYYKDQNYSNPYNIQPDRREFERQEIY